MISGGASLPTFDLQELPDGTFLLILSQVDQPTTSLILDSPSSIRLIQLLTSRVLHRSLAPPVAHLEVLPLADDPQLQHGQDSQSAYEQLQLVNR